jgi:hypothetical protein
MLIDDIIDLLGRVDGSLSEALLKTKILLHQIGKKELAEWVNKELTGYGPDDDVPAYRVLHAQIIGHVANMAMKANNFPLPINHLDDKTRNRLQKIPMRESLEALTKLASAKQLAINFAPEFYGAFDEGLEAGTHVQRAWRQLSPEAVSQILINVRSRLLDFILELRDQVGSGKNEAEVSEKSKAVNLDQMFNKAIFGDNATLIFGDANQQHVRNEIKQNDIDSLHHALKAAGVEEIDLAELKAAVEDDDRMLGKASFGGETGKWYMALLSKAAKGGYKIGVDIVGSVVSRALSAYMGVG